MKTKRNPFVNYHNIKVQKGSTKRPSKEQILTYRTSAWPGGKGIKILYGIRKKPSVRGGRSVIMSLRYPKAYFTVSEAKKHAKKHFKIVKVEEAKPSKKTPKRTCKKRGCKTKPKGRKKYCSKHQTR